MKLSLRLKLLIFIISLCSVFIYTYSYYSNRKKFYNHLKTDGTITPTFTKFFSSKDSPWYGTNTQEFCFITTKGDTIRWREKAINELNFTIDFYCPWTDSVIYNLKNPNEYMFIKYYKEYSDSSDKIIYFAVCFPLGTVFLFLLIIMIIRMINIKRNSLLNGK